MDDNGGRRPYARLSGEGRTLFLKLLRETGNRRAAAAAIGVEARLMDQRREHDPELDRDWRAALDEAHLGLALAKGPFDCPQGKALNTIRRGRSGRLQLVAAGEERWSAAVEERFKEALRACGNVRAAARAVGFTESAVWQRRRAWPAFAAMLEELLEEAELTLELRIASMGSNVLGGAETGTVASNCPPGEGAPPPLPFDADFAMRFLKWREEKRRGGGRWAPRARPPSIEEVTARIVRKVEAIKRHPRRSEGAKGDSHSNCPPDEKGDSHSDCPRRRVTVPGD
ncbi:MAG TPA: hypothetical protein VMS43_13755 [Allosphingosinicella sp.]|nr:hypothetical protein [Allosphingosinicella sp.]